MTHRSEKAWARTAVIVTIAMVGIGCASSPSSSSTPPQAPSPATIPSSTPSSENASPAPSASLTPILPLPVSATIGGFYGAADVASSTDAVWVLDHSDSSVWPIDPETNTVGKPVDVAPSGSATYLIPSEGLLWTSAFESGDVVGFDPVKRKVTKTIQVGDLDGGALAAGDGAVWVIQGGSRKLVKVDPKKAKVAATFQLPDDCHDSLLAADGFVWTASVTGHLCKLDPTSGDVVAELDGVGAPITMAWGGGRIWVPTADGGIVLVDPAGPSIAATLAAAPPGEVDGGKYTLGTPDENARIVADDTGAWVRYSHGTMGRVDLAPDPHWTIYAGLKGAFMGDEATAFDSVWIADTEQVLRIPAPTP